MPSDYNGPELLCSVTCPSSAKLVKHLLQHNEYPIFCQFPCDKRFSCYRDLKCHQRGCEYWDRGSRQVYVWCGCCRQLFTFPKWARNTHIHRHLEEGHVSQPEELGFVIGSDALVASMHGQTEAQALQSYHSPEYNQPREDQLPPIQSVIGGAQDRTHSQEYYRAREVQLPSIQSLVGGAVDKADWETQGGVYMI